MLSRLRLLKRLTLASPLLAALALACSSTPPDGESASRTSEATSAVHPTCALPYTAVCDAAGATCRCQLDPAASPSLPAKDIAAGASSTYLIKNDGTVWGWGAAGVSDGLPLGPVLPGDTNGNQFPDSVTVPMALGVSNAVQLAASDSGACALLADGTVSCWGTLLLGGDSQVPTLVRAAGSSAALSNVASISRGTAHVCALVNDGSVACWGDNRFGQLGDGTSGDSETDAVAMKVWPAMQALTATQVVAAGNTTCVRYSNGSVYCVGENTKGQLGLGSHNDVLPTTQPQPVQSIANVDLLFGGGIGTFCVHQAKTATTAESTQCWGDDENDQLDGVDPTHDAYSPHEHPVKIAGQVTRAFSDYNGCAWATDGTPTCWGLTTYGVFGSDITPHALSSTRIVQMAIGGDHACAISRREVTCWGMNDRGQLGIGNTAATSGAALVSNIPTTASECPYGDHGVSCASSGNGLTGDGCACPVCVPLTQKQACKVAPTCGIKSDGCGSFFDCGDCPLACPPGLFRCTPNGECTKFRCRP